MRRALFCLIWTVVLFVTAVVLLSFVGLAVNGGDAEKQRQFGEKLAPVLVCVPFPLALVLTLLGLLPGTRKRKPAPATEPVSFERNRADDAEPDSAAERTPRPSSAVSQHEWSLGGFWSRWKLFLSALPMFGGLGLIFIVAGRNKGPQIQYVGLGFLALGLLPQLVVVYRFLALQWVRLSDDGIDWGGMLGSSHRDWDQITDVYRTEKITNRTYATREVRLDFADGGSVTFDQSLTGYDDLAASLQETTFDLIMPAKLAELKEKGKATFGPVTLQNDGVDMNGELFAWGGIGRYTIINGHLSVFPLGRRGAGNDTAIPLSEIPNYTILLEMMSTKATRS